jgi:hypothetical protein
VDERSSYGHKLAAGSYATATLEAWNTSAGIGWCSRQVIAIGFSPSCET